MDLTVSKGTWAESETLRNLYLGFVGAACKVDAAALARSFHCGSVCTADRRNGLVSNLERIKRVTKAFAALAGVDLVSQWGVRGEFRVNNAFTLMGQTNEAKPSPMMGFIPWDVWEHFSVIGEYLKTKHISEAAFNELLKEIKALSLAAVVREKRAVRVVRVGIADNESGLLFLKHGEPLPVVGQGAEGGRRYVVIEQIEDGLVFYETD